MINRLANHFAAAAAVVALTGSVEAQVVKSPFVAQVIPNTFEGLYIDVETGVVSTTGSFAGYDINPYNTSSLIWFHAATSAMMRFPTVVAGGAGSLNYSTVVGPAGSYSANNTAATVGAAPGNWRLNSDNYFGFRFQAADLQTRFGWGRFTVFASISGADRRIEEIYYEQTPNTPIAIGSYGTSCGGLTFEQSDLPRVGTSFNFTVGNMPPAAGLNALLLDIGTLNPGLSLAPTWPGCSLYLAAPIIAFQLVTPSVVWPFSVPANPLLVGFQLNAQGAASWIDASGLQLVTSQGIFSVIGI